MAGRTGERKRAKIVAELDKDGRWAQKAVRRYRSREWVKDMRRALGIKVDFLVDETQVSRKTLYLAEAREATGAIQIAELEALAKAMECRLVYAIVPERGTVAELAERRREFPRKTRTEREKENKEYEEWYANEVARARKQDPRNWSPEELLKAQGLEKPSTADRDVMWTGIDGRGAVRRVHSAGVQKLAEDIASKHAGEVGKVMRDAAEKGKGSGE